MMDQPVAKPSFDIRQIRSRRALNEALLALLKEKAFDRISVREISARAGTGYATFFRHYASKEALLSDIASAQIEDLFNKTIPMLFSAGSQNSTQALCQFVHDDRQLWSALLTGGAAATMRAEFVRQAREWAAAAPSIQDGIPRDLAVAFGAGSAIDVLAWWLDHEDEISVEQISDILRRLAVEPLIGERLRAAKSEAG